MANNHKLASLASRQHGIVSHSQLEECGFSRHQVKRRVANGQWTRVSARVVSLIGVPTSWDQRVTAAGLEVSRHGALSHRAAGRIWGFRTVDDEIDVAIRYPRQMSIPGVVVHRSRDLIPSDITSVNGVPVTTPERTLCDYGLIFPEHEVERVLRHAVSSANPLVSRGDILQLRLRIRAHGRDGAGKIGRSLERLPRDAEATESGPEVLLLEICETYGLPKPVCQLPIVVAGRRFRVDFAYPELKVFIEVDGDASHSGDRIALDGGRQNLLVAAGWRPIRLAYDTMKKSPDWCASILRDIYEGAGDHSA